MVAAVHSTNLNDPRFVVELAWMAWIEAPDCPSARRIVAHDSHRRPCTDGGLPVCQTRQLAHRFHDFVAFEDRAHTLIEQGKEGIFRHR